MPESRHGCLSDQTDPCATVARNAGPLCAGTNNPDGGQPKDVNPIPLSCSRQQRSGERLAQKLANREPIATQETIDLSARPAAFPVVCEESEIWPKSSSPSASH